MLNLRSKESVSSSQAISENFLVNRLAPLNRNGHTFCKMRCVPIWHIDKRGINHRSKINQENGISTEPWVTCTACTRGRTNRPRNRRQRPWPAPPEPCTREYRWTIKVYRSKSSKHNAPVNVGEVEQEWVQGVWIERSKTKDQRTVHRSVRFLLGVVARETQIGDTHVTWTHWK